MKLCRFLVVVYVFLLFCVVVYSTSTTSYEEINCYIMSSRQDLNEIKKILIKINDLVKILVKRNQLSDGLKEERK